MLIAQALGEYGATAALADGIATARISAEELTQEWALMAVGVAVAAAIAWKMFTRIR